MNRRLFVCGSFVTLATAMDALAKTEAAPATPVATPQPTPLTPLSGLEEGVFRSYQLVGLGISTMIAGQPEWLSFEFLQFTSTTLAKRATSIFRDNIAQANRNSLNTGWTMGTLRAVSVHSFGDESSGWAYSITTDNPDVAVDEYVLGLVIARKARWLYSVSGEAASGNIFPLLSDLAADMVKRRIGESTVTVDASGLHHGGMWDVLPGLHDVPEGYEFSIDDGE